MQLPRIEALWTKMFKVYHESECPGEILRFVASDFRNRCEVGDGSASEIYGKNVYDKFELTHVGLIFVRDGSGKEYFIHKVSISFNTGS